MVFMETIVRDADKISILAGSYGEYLDVAQKLHPKKSTYLLDYSMIQSGYKRPLLIVCSGAKNKHLIVSRFSEIYGEDRVIYA